MLRARVVIVFLLSLVMVLLPLSTASAQDAPAPPTTTSATTPESAPATTAPTTTTAPPTTTTTPSAPTSAPPTSTSAPATTPATPTSTRAPVSAATPGPGATPDRAVPPDQAASPQASTASISGKVVNASGAALSGVIVSAAAGGFSRPVQGYTSFDGTYRIASLPAGSYTVKFTDTPKLSSPAMYVPQYFSGADTADAATPVVVGDGAAVTDVDATLVLGATISGRVTTTSGTAVTDVSIFATGPDGDPASSGPVASDGTYSIGRLPAGTYTVEFIPSYSSPLLGQYWRGATSEADATPVTVAAGGSATRIDAQLVTGGTASGRVTDASGQPVEGAYVFFSGQGEGSTSSASTNTGSDGTYTIAGLSGSYTVTFFSPDQDLLSEYFSDATTQETATPVVVDPGQARTGVDAQLAAAGSITGRVTDSAGQPVPGAAVLVDSGTGSINSRNYVTTDDTGAYSAGSLEAGSYTVYFDPAEQGRSDLAAEYWRGAREESTATRVTVAAGAATGLISPVLQRAAIVTGTLRDSDGAVVPDLVDVTALTPSGEDLQRTRANNGFGGQPDGTYSLENLRAGSTVVAFGRASSFSTYAPSYWKGSTTLAGATQLPLQAGTTTSDIDPVLTHGASISGVVRGADGKPLAGELVVAWGTSAGNPGRSTLTLDDGSYTVSGLLPGAHFVALAPYVDGADHFYGGGTTAPANPNVGVPAAGAAVGGVDITIGEPVVTRFSDVPRGSQFEADINALVARGVTTGYSDGTFRPTAAVSRQAMAAFLYRSAGSPAFTPPTTPTFTDVPADSTFYAQVEWLYARGISTGTLQPDGTRLFKPGDAVSRQAMAAFLNRAGQSPT